MSSVVLSKKQLLGVLDEILDDNEQLGMDIDYDTNTDKLMRNDKPFPVNVIKTDKTIIRLEMMGIKKLNE